MVARKKEERRGTLSEKERKRLRCSIWRIWSGEMEHGLHCVWTSRYCIILDCT